MPCWGRGLSTRSLKTALIFLQCSLCPCSSWFLGEWPVHAAVKRCKLYLTLVLVLLPSAFACAPGKAFDHVLKETQRSLPLAAAEAPWLSPVSQAYSQWENCCARCLEHGNSAMEIGVSEDLGNFNQMPDMLEGRFFPWE